MISTFLLLWVLFLPNICTAAAATGYVGSDICVECHRVTQPEIVSEWEQSRHHQSIERLQLEEKTRFPATSNLSHAVFTITGPKRRMFLDADMNLLPLQWKQDESNWEDMIQTDTRRNCLGCHTTGYNAAAGEFVETGIGCEACHGAGGEHAAAGGGTNNIVNPANLDAARSRMICGQCHSDGTDLTGLFPFPVMQLPDNSCRPFQPGDDLAEVFKDNAPLILGKSRQYSLLLQAPEYFKSSHCNECHRSHGNQKHAGMLKDNTGDLCLSCHKVKMRNPAQHWPGSDEHPCWACHQYAHTH